ncbi:glycogen/starch/alpha-glucan phosphorylase, partial [Anaerotignum sp.]
MSFIEKDVLKELIRENVKTLYRKTLEHATPEELYQAAVFAIREVITDKWMKTHDDYYEKDVKVVYYLSMEFLMGRFFGNALINLEMFDEVKEVFEELGIDYNMVEDAEPDPGLGNGGLGRLAACFLESLSTLSLPAYGCGIRYHYGIFEQKIENGYQVEAPDNWLENGDPWGIKRNEYAVEVKFGGNVRAVANDKGGYKMVHENYQSVTAIPYDYPVIGYGNNTVNTLRLWEAKPKTRLDLKSFNEGNYQKAAEEEMLANTLSNVLYPADEHVQGKELRLRQQYFFVSATIQRVIARFKKMHTDFNELPDKVAFQLNDTHPSMAVAELMRVLVDENDVPWEQAWDITRKVCAYTNHTILSEALEKWPMELFSRLLPRIYQIVEEINRRFMIELTEKYGNDFNKIRNMAIIADGQIRMAYLAIVGSHSVNGVAALHTEILKNQELKNFYELYPEKFNNKTNGITQRRWLVHSNRELADLICEKIGKGWVTDLDELQKLIPYADDADFRNRFMEIKRANKVALANYIKETKGIDVNPDSIFDIQVKRLHEYKRQQLNVLYIIHKYFEIKAGKKPATPITLFFGAKAAPAYIIAKDIIHAILCLQQIINNDPEVAPYLKVFMVENYNVTLAEKLIPVCDISEQISLASKEASGTGNMKFMLNGAVTLGTSDGANVEIAELVGEDNIYVFGEDSETVIARYERGDYCSRDYYEKDED